MALQETGERCLFNFVVNCPAKSIPCWSLKKRWLLGIYESLLLGIVPSLTHSNMWFYSSALQTACVCFSLSFSNLLIALFHFVRKYDCSRWSHIRHSRSEWLSPQSMESRSASQLGLWCVWSCLSIKHRAMHLQSDSSIVAVNCVRVGKTVKPGKSSFVACWKYACAARLHSLTRVGQVTLQNAMYYILLLTFIW